jgi:enamine deaminase RidA (YjgF/YER057c/UK114 family)
MHIENKLNDLRLTLPAPLVVPPEISVSFAWTRRRGTRLYVSGHIALRPDGVPAGPFGTVPRDVPLAVAQEAARGATLAILASLKRELEDLDRVTAWLMVHGLVNAEPGYPLTTNVINGCSDLILNLYGPEVGQHARLAVGVAALPLNAAVTIAAEVEIAA